MTLSKKIKKYASYLKEDDHDKINHALSRLEDMEMTLNLLTSTHIGRTVNKLCSHSDFGDHAQRIVAKWKQIALKNGVKERRDVNDDDSGYRERKRARTDSSSNESHEEENRDVKPSRESLDSRSFKEEVHSDRHSSEERDVKPTKQDLDYDMERAKADRQRERDRDAYEKEKQREVKPVVKKEKREKASSSSSGFSFEQLLSQPAPSKPKKKSLPEGWNNDTPEIDLNYRPVPMLLSNRAPVAPAPAAPVEMVNPEQMFKPRKDQRKIYAGKRKGHTLTEVPTLYATCIKVISSNISALEETGDIPFHILQPVLDKCTPQQLAYIESRNPYLEEDSDCLWEKLVNKGFSGRQKKSRETWKEAYRRMEHEDEDRLIQLSQRLNSKRDDAEKGQRKAMFADAAAPREVRKRQRAHGTGHLNKVLPHAIEVSNARRQIFETGSKKSLAALPSAVVARSSTVGAKKGPEGGRPPPKKGALMQKTLKMMKMKRR